jgi:hypothetical protein
MDLAFSEAKNKLVFEPKQTQIKAKKVAKNSSISPHGTGIQRSES